jgi:hypothetical protein
MSDRLPQRGKVYRVPVTEEHIAAGRPASTAECPIALAVLQAFPGLEGVLVCHDDAHAWRGEGGVREEWVWRHDGRAFTSEFDQGFPVSPWIVSLYPAVSP